MHAFCVVLERRKDERHWLYKDFPVGCVVWKVFKKGIVNLVQLAAFRIKCVCPNLDPRSCLEDLGQRFDVVFKAYQALSGRRPQSIGHAMGCRFGSWHQLGKKRHLPSCV